MTLIILREFLAELNHLYQSLKISKETSIIIFYYQNFLIFIFKNLFHFIFINVSFFFSYQVDLI
jgi:hypothetical protein